LHNLFFGGNNVRSMGTAVHTTLDSLSYTGDTKNYNFDKYITKHVKQNNIAALLKEFGGAPLDEARKIDMLITGIWCNDFDTTKNSTNATPQRFTDFDSVKDHFIKFRCLQLSHPLRQLVAVMEEDVDAVLDAVTETQVGPDQEKRLVPNPLASQAYLIKQTLTARCTSRRGTTLLMSTPCLPRPRSRSCGS
jgi:hypothetical protein